MSLRQMYPIAFTSLALLAFPARAADAPKPVDPNDPTALHTVQITNQDIATIRGAGNFAGALCDTSPQGVVRCFYVVKAADLANRLEQQLQAKPPTGK